MATTRLRVVPSDPPESTRRGRTPAKKAPAKKAPAKRTAAAKKKLTLAEAIETGDQLKILQAQRDEIVESLPREKGQAKATLHRLLVDVTDRIAALQKQAEVTSGKSKVVANTANDAWDQSAV